MRTARSSREWSRRVKGKGRADGMARHCRGVSAFNLDVRVVARSRSVGEELGTGQRPELGAWPTAPACSGERRRHGVTAKTEREEME